jgi:alkyl hydroperoxide reductase subunit AhpF
MMLAILVFTGAEANTGWLEEAVELDERGFILTERALERSALEENVWRGLSR